MKQLTAAFDAAYTEAIGTGANPPSPDDVFTIWPGSPAAIIRTNVEVQIAIPNTLTPKHQRQSFGSCPRLAAPTARDAGVVEQQVHPTVGVVDRAGEVGDGLLVGDVHQ